MQPFFCKFESEISIVLKELIISSSEKMLSVDRSWPNLFGNGDTSKIIIKSINEK